jgi:hypothetical protein
MSHHQRKQKKDKSLTAQTLKKRLVVLISLLSVSIAVLMFRVGENLWPVWIVDARSRIIGILILALVLAVLLSPLILESQRRPREFPGPGKNPYIDP